MSGPNVYQLMSTIPELETIVECLHEKAGETKDELENARITQVAFRFHRIVGRLKALEAQHPSAGNLKPRRVYLCSRCASTVVNVPGAICKNCLDPEAA